MSFKVDFRDDGTPVQWEADTGATGAGVDGAAGGDATAAATTDGSLPGATATPDPDYRPALYVAARDDRTRYLDWLADALALDPKVTGVSWEQHRRDLRTDEPSPMLRVELERIGEVRQAAREIRAREQDVHAPGVLELFDVDLDPQFRYCLDTGSDPSRSERELRRLSLSLPDPALASGDLTALTVDGDPADGDSGSERVVRRRVERTLRRRDPDVLVLSSADIVPLLAEAGVDLGRRPGYRQLAGASTYTSYGQVGHSPARYDVPGRVIVDRSNSFLLGKSRFVGLNYFVEQAGKPLQEIAHDSIGGVLTAVEIREARDRDVLAPWQKRQTEGWKSVERLHAADRGGFTFQPDPGVHEDVLGSESDRGLGRGCSSGVHELDFASLYPNIIREYDVSPDVICCGCHDGADVPELDYSVCPDGDAFLGAVLGDLLDDRRDWKQERERVADGSDEMAELDAKVEAVKWVLVSCFGYQGYRHAKFGRIEVHEAINAFARDVMLTAKEAFEAGGWRVVHGIVDSLWVTADPGRDQRPVEEIATEVTDEVGIRLEHEGRFDWVAFCPRKRASGAALMRYFGRWADESVREDDDRYKFRGIDARQRSTCEFVAAAQRDLVATFDDKRSPEAVCERLRVHLAALRRGSVSWDDLAIRQRVSKRADDYEQATRAKATLERAAELGLERHPGQSVEYVVVDDDASGPQRVRLAFEDGDGSDIGNRGVSDAANGDAYDAGFYADRLIRACESVLSPLGWDEGRIRRYLRDDRDATLSSFTDTSP